MVSLLTKAANMSLENDRIIPASSTPPSLDTVPATSSASGQATTGNAYGVLVSGHHSSVSIGASPQHSARSEGKLAKAASIATILAVVIATAAWLSPQREKTDEEKPPFGVSSGARIVNSGSDGVYTYAGPSTENRYPDGGHLDNNLVRVVCQERNGQPVKDSGPAPGQPEVWKVWNKLSNGRWIPDLWTDLPKDEGPTPPKGLPIC